MVPEDQPEQTEVEDNSQFSDEDLSGPVVDRRTTLSLLSIAGLSGLAGCTGGGGGSEANSSNTSNNSRNSTKQSTGADEKSQSSNKVGGKMTIGWNIGSITELDPPYITDQKTFPIMANIFNGLVMLKEDLTVRGDLAKDWNVSDNGKQFTFNLREGVKFHNGSEFTADDVKYTINRTISEETPSASKLSGLRSLDKNGVVVQDKYTVQLNFEKAMAPALIYLTRGPGRAATIVSQSAIEEMGREKYSTAPVGTGPFQVANHNVGTALKLEKFDEYFKTDNDGVRLPYLDSIEINPIPEASTLINSIRSSDVDFIDSVPLQKVSSIEKAEGIERITAPGVNFNGLAMNNEREPFTSKKVRLAIAKLIDRKKLVSDAFFGNALPDTGPINKGTAWVWRTDKPNTQQYAPEEGKKMLEEEGAAGASFSITTTEIGLREAKVVRQQLNQAGLNVEINQVTSSTFSSILPESDFDATLIGSGGDPDPDQSLYNFFRLPDKDGPWNYMQYKNQTVHNLLGEQRRQLDREKRKQTLWEIENKVMEEAPFAFLYHEDDIAAKQPYVKGYPVISGLRYFDTVWLDK